mmetsp:Transcript_24296/g.70959  ORF Transcript_24296/g.70959 Transcript_24296/m.70959 type:complete len:272 (+) Transcript_24296:550-1365(+)
MCTFGSGSPACSASLACCLSSSTKQLITSSLSHSSGLRVAMSLRVIGVLLISKSFSAGLPGCRISLTAASSASVSCLGSKRRRPGGKFSSSTSSASGSKNSCSAAAAAASGIPTAALVGATPYPVVPSALLHSSLLLGSLADSVLPPLTPDSLAVQLHPAAVVGFTSALCNALQLLPVGRLDGGRIAAAVLGSGAASLTSSLFLLGLGLQSLFGGDDPALLFFGLLIIFFQREPELPCADDLTGVDTPRQAAAAAALAIALLIVAPSPLLG